MGFAGSNGPDPKTIEALHTMGFLLHHADDPVGARRRFDQVQKATVEVLGAEHPETASMLARLGNMLLIMGDAVVARQHLERTYQIRKGVLGPDSSTTATALSNWGSSSPPCASCRRPANIWSEHWRFVKRN